MTTIERTVTTTAPPETVFPSLAVRNATEWDSGTVSCDRVSGDGGSSVVHRAEFGCTGLARFLGPVLTPLPEWFGDRTAAQLRVVPDRP